MHTLILSYQLYCVKFLLLFKISLIWNVLKSKWFFRLNIVSFRPAPLWNPNFSLTIWGCNVSITNQNIGNTLAIAKVCMAAASPQLQQL